MLFSTTDTLQGYTIEEYLGPVYAACRIPYVSDTGIFKKNGRVERFSQNAMMDILFRGLKAHAENRRANAVIAIRFMVGKEDHVFAMGTAVQISPEPPDEAGFHPTNDDVRIVSGPIVNEFEQMPAYPNAEPDGTPIPVTVEDGVIVCPNCGARQQPRKACFKCKALFDIQGEE